ncbi:hypothetical protein BDV12DRAFT_204017 [Aspergillus spectabilis]
MAVASSIAYLCLGLVGTWVIGQILTLLHRLARGRLNQIPGPSHTKYTHLGLKLATLQGRRMYYVDDLHSRFGPVVRLTPTEVAVADVQAFLAIHKVSSGFNKSIWYQELVPFPRSTVFTMNNPKQHAARRKLLARGFSKSHLRQHWEPIVMDKVRSAVDRMKTEARTGTVDILKWWTFMATDTATLIMFGNSFQMIEHGKTNKYIRTLQQAMMGSAMGYEFPVLRHIGKWLPWDIFRELFDSTPYLMEYGKNAIRGSRERGDTVNIFSKMIGDVPTNGETLDELDVVLEASGLIVAGSDTTAISLTYLVWAVLGRPELHHAILEELIPLKEDFTDEDVEGLPLVNAVIDETLRLYGAAPGGLPRVVPAQGLTIRGHYLPGGTTVTTQAYTIHRDGEIFDNPLKFDPYRWIRLREEEKATSEHELALAAFHPFGAGSRICLGIHLARMELRLATVQFFRHCPGARLAASTTAESMEMENFFLIAPKSHRCNIEIPSAMDR